MQKIILGLFIVFVITLVGVLLTPLSLFQNQIVSRLNEIEHLNVVLEGKLGYQLIKPDHLEIGKARIQYKNTVVHLNDLELNLSLNKIFSHTLAIDLLRADIERIEILESLKERSPSSESGGGFSIEIEKIFISNLNLKLKHYTGPGGAFDDIALKGTDSQLILHNLVLSARPTLSAGREMLEISSTLKGELKKYLDFELSTTKADIARILKYFNLPNFNITGITRLKAQGKMFFSNPLESLVLESTIDATDLKWVGRDIDAILGSYIGSRQLGVLDAAGFLTMGPIGLLVSKGVNVSKTGLQGVISGESEIDRLYVRSHISDGSLKIEDAAMATQRFRVAAKGSFRIIPDYQFKDFVVSTVDERGCSLFEQEISGTLKKPSIGVLSSAAGEALASVGDLFKRARKLIGNCDPFYEGIVKAPGND